MERILSDLRHRRTGMLVRCVIYAAVIGAGAWIPFIFSGSWAEWLRYVWAGAASLLSAMTAVLLVKAFIDALITAPCRLKAQLEALPENELEEVISSYPDAKSLGERWFLPQHILFYTNRRAVIIRYDAIKTVSPDKNGDLRLGTSCGDIVMPVKAGENAAIIYAVLHGKNKELKAEFVKKSEPERT